MDAGALTNNCSFAQTAHLVGCTYAPCCSGVINDIVRSDGEVYYLAVLAYCPEKSVVVIVPSEGCAVQLNVARC